MKPETWKFLGVLLIVQVLLSPAFSVLMDKSLSDAVTGLLFITIVYLPIGLICLIRAVSLELREAREEVSFIALRNAEKPSKSERSPLGLLVVVFSAAVLFGVRFFRPR